MYVLSRPRSRVAGYVDRDLGEGRQSDAKARGEAKSVRPKLDFWDVARVGAFHKRSKNTPPVRRGEGARGGQINRALAERHTKSAILAT
jgi:hypothetical protein